MGHIVSVLPPSNVEKPHFNTSVAHIEKSRNSYHFGHRNQSRHSVRHPGRGTHSNTLNGPRCPATEPGAYDAPGGRGRHNNESAWLARSCYGSVPASRPALGIVGTSWLLGDETRPSSDPDYTESLGRACLLRPVGATYNGPPIAEGLPSWVTRRVQCPVHAQSPTRATRPLHGVRPQRLS